jgi:hypothetical protein
MSRIATQTSNSSWTCPAGVTEVTLMPSDSSAVPTGLPVRVVTVTPNTTYTITINSTTYSLGSANTFGSLYSWSASTHLTMIWVE